MTTVTVRKIAAADQAEADEVDRLATLDLRKVYRPNDTAVQRRKKLGRLVKLVAVVDGRIVGTAQYQIRNRQLSFLGLGVHPAVRRRGVATAVIKELERIARKSDCETLALYTVRETGNVKIFERMGFVVKSEEPSRLFESDRYKLLTEVFMSKNVNALKG